MRCSSSDDCESYSKATRCTKPQSLARLPGSLVIQNWEGEKPEPWKRCRAQISRAAEAQPQDQVPAQLPALRQAAVLARIGKSPIFRT